VCIQCCFDTKVEQQEGHAAHKNPLVVGSCKSLHCESTAHPGSLGHKNGCLLICSSGQNTAADKKLELVGWLQWY